MKTLKGYKVNILSIDDNSPINKIILNNKKISQDDEDIFFLPKLSDLHNPESLEGTQVATKRILEARNNKERVVVFGDYDVDGVSSTAMLVRFFHEIGIEVSYRLPHRANDGYGLKKHFIDDIAKNNVKLIVTVDCGTRDIDVINYANSLGIDMIITDHHVVPEVIPDNAIALINPKRSDSKYPNKNLSGSGVAFKLLHSISLKLFGGKNTESILKNYIDFAMLGTISDCMPLTGENRTIAYLGLKQLKYSKSHGLKKLIEGSDIDNIDGDIVGFKIGPKLNAAGRMDTPYKALKVLLAGEQNLNEIMDEIESLNTKRKVSTEKFIIDANKIVDNKNNALFYDSTEIEHGIIGLIAGRLSETYNKLAIVFKDEGERLVGSARGPVYLSLVSILDECKDLFEVYGGHDQAAGFTMSKSNFDEFKKKIDKIVGVKIHKLDITKVITIDTEIKIEDIDDNLLKFIESLKPFGIGNTKPLFLLRDIKFDRIDYLGKENKHLKFKLNSSKLEFKSFGTGEFYKEFKTREKISIIFELEKNIWNGRENLSLNIKDFLI